MDDELRASIQTEASHVRQIAVARGMRTLRDDGLRQVRARVTTLEEVLRVTRA
jgi:general secretion pathway protein E